QSFTTDEPVESGGEGAGPDPYTLLLAALGSCISMTVTLYARRKNWPVERVRVRLRMRRVHANDCSDCETKGDAFVHRVERSVATFQRGRTSLFVIDARRSRPSYMKRMRLPPLLLSIAVLSSLFASCRSESRPDAAAGATPSTPAAAPTPPPGMVEVTTDTL